MTVPAQEVSDNKPTVQQENFAAIRRKMEETDRRYSEEKQKRMELEKQMEDIRKRFYGNDDDDSDEFVEKKYIRNEFSRVEKDINNIKQETKRLEEERMKREQDLWMHSHPDFEEVLKSANDFEKDNQEVANSLLNIPEGFERYKSAYNMIKLYKEAKNKPAAPTMQDHINNNRRPMYYAPSGMATPPSQQFKGSYTKEEMKSAHEAMLALKNEMRLG
ncbi:MAG: hypothetical protein KGI50_05335 [Patescibacteria group bacterium]|nr:hypothetical protein [Patescibacteria group bacterium]MDE2438771.1 hypothetical protein [Patescibacteria group bacterium]